MLLGLRMAGANPDASGGGGADPYRPIKCVPFIQEREAFKCNMREQLARIGFEYYDVSKLLE